MKERTDDALIQLARAGDRPGLAAYEELVRRHQGRALRLATYLLGNDSDAADVAQEAFVRAHAALARARDDTNFGAWLRTIVTRLAFNTQRDQRARARREHGDDEGRAGLPSSTRTAVEWTLAQLAYPYREILILRFVEEMSLDEIAATLDIGLSAAKMRIARARSQFHEIYQREHATPLPFPAEPPPGDER